MPVETGMISDAEAEAMAAGEAAPPSAAVTDAPDVTRHPETPQVDATPPAPAPPTPDPAPTVSTVSPDEVLDAAESPNVPPPEVAGLAVLEAEQQAQKPDTHPVVVVRGKTFRLRRKIPGMLLLKLTKTQVEVSRPAMQADAVAQAQALSASYDAMVKLVLPEEQDAFVEWCEDAEPEIEMSELMQDVLKQMMEAVTGHPTQSASA